MFKKTNLLGFENSNKMQLQNNHNKQDRQLKCNSFGSTMNERQFCSEFVD